MMGGHNGDGALPKALGQERMENVEVEHIWNVWKNIYGTYREDKYGTYGKMYIGFLDLSQKVREGKRKIGLVRCTE